MTKPSVTSRVLLTMFGGLAFLAVVATGGSATDAAPAAAPVPGAVTARLLVLQEQGPAVYAERCALCHQPDGTGIPGIFPALAGNARSADPAYVDDVIRNGLTGPIEIDGVPYEAAMPTVDLSDEERAAVVDYVVSLATSAPGTDVDTTESAGPVPGADTGPLPALQEQGTAVYGQRCASCHQPDGAGIPGVFPPLAGNARSADPAYVDDVIRNGLSGPIEIDGVPYDAVMSAIDLSDEDRAAVVHYVVSLAAPAPGTDVDTTESAVAQPVTGDVDRGRRLFVGSTGFDNGGAACASCHQAGDVGHRGGSSLGPDLDASHTNFGGGAGLAAWLAAPASPIMQPIFVDRPLTEPEIADLVAFLETAPDRTRPRSYGDGLLLGGLVGLGVLLGGMAAVRRTMKPSYSQRLRSRS